MEAGRLLQVKRGRGQGLGEYLPGGRRPFLPWTQWSAQRILSPERIESHRAVLRAGPDLWLENGLRGPLNRVVKSSII